MLNSELIPLGDVDQQVSTLNADCHGVFHYTHPLRMAHHNSIIGHCFHVIFSIVADLA
jgi:hypothetical protein